MNHRVMSVSVVACAALAGSSARADVVTKDVSMWCGETTHFRITKPGLDPLPFSITGDQSRSDGSWELTTKSHEDVYVWKVVDPKKKKPKAAENPLYHDGGAAGENPFYDAKRVTVTFVDVASEATDDPDAGGLFVDGPQSDQYIPYRVLFSFENEAGDALAEFVMDGLPVFTSLLGGDFAARDHGVWTLGGGPVLLTPVVNGLRTNDLGYDLYVDGMAMVTDGIAVPAPGAGLGVMGVGGVALGRRRRRGESAKR